MNKRPNKAAPALMNQDQMSLDFMTRQPHKPKAPRKDDPKTAYCALFPDQARP